MLIFGEDCFFSGCEFLRFNKNRLNAEDRNRLENLTNFEIIMSIIKDKNPSIQQSKTCALMVLSLLFPNYTIEIKNDILTDLKIVFKQDNLEFSLNKNNYDDFIKTLNEMLCLNDSISSNDDYNPSGNLAKQIADKLRDGHAKVMESKNNGNQKIAILTRYVSILAVGENKDMNSLMNYTIYQLFDEFKRYQLKLN